MRPILFWMECEMIHWLLRHDGTNLLFRDKRDARDTCKTTWSKVGAITFNTIGTTDYVMLDGQQVATIELANLLDRPTHL